MKKYEKEVKKYLKERKWDNLRPADIAKSISIEASELLENFQWSNETLEELKKDKDKVNSVKKELADILIYCFNMSVLMGFDTGKILLDKLEKVKEKYPAHLFKNRDKKVDPGSESVYWKIKKEYRRKGKN
jgi:NTP pyrophosphatase (non-canonical NTP hydrolase)